MVEKETG